MNQTYKQAHNGVGPPAGVKRMKSSSWSEYQAWMKPTDTTPARQQGSPICCIRMLHSME